MSTHIFGPVPSRRLGISLGVDLIPYKTCSLDCIYCECGPTSVCTTERRRFSDPVQVLGELQNRLAAHPQLDAITFSGSGEPTLHSDLGFLITEIKRLTSIAVAVLTNSTLLPQPEVRADLQAADIVLPSLDAASEDVFQRINRPCPGLHADQLIAGLTDFRRKFAGQLWLEVFIVRGINDHEGELNALHEAICRIDPDKVQLNTIDRPPACAEARAVEMPFLEQLIARWHDLPVEVIKRVRRKEEITAFSQNLENNILNTVRRRPLTVDDLVSLTGMKKVELLKYIDILEKEKKIAPQISGGKVFYTAFPSGPLNTDQIEGNGTPEDR